MAPPGTVTLDSLPARVVGAHSRDAHSSMVATTVAESAPTTHHRACTTHPAISTSTVTASAPNEKRPPPSAVTTAAASTNSDVSRKIQSPRTMVGSRRASTTTAAANAMTTYAAAQTATSRDPGNGAAYWSRIAFRFSTAREPSASFSFSTTPACIFASRFCGTSYVTSTVTFTPPACGSALYVNVLCAPVVVL